MSKLFLSVAASGAILAALTAAPEQVKEPVLKHLGEYLSAQTVDRAITAAKVLLGLGIARNVAEFLSELAQNDFRLSSEKSKYDWPNEIAVITGGAGGFGSLMAKDFASRGVHVVILDIFPELPAPLQNNPKITYFKCDITDGEAVKKVADEVRSTLGNPSILINNAGVAHGQLSILNITEKQVKQLYGVNIVSHFNTVREFMPAMIAAKKGHIVTISSMAAFVCSPGLVAYSSSKSAALVFHEGLQQELRTFHNAPEVKCTVVHPTFADTPMVAKFKESLQKTTAKLITPESVANAVVQQVLSGRGKQIVLNGNLPYFLTSLRGFPHWISGTILMGANRAMKVCFQVFELHTHNVFFERKAHFVLHRNRLAMLSNRGPLSNSIVRGTSCVLDVCFDRKLDEKVCGFCNVSRSYVHCCTHILLPRNFMTGA